MKAPLPFFIEHKCVCSQVGRNTHILVIGDFLYKWIQYPICKESTIYCTKISEIFHNPLQLGTAIMVDDFIGKSMQDYMCVNEVEEEVKRHTEHQTLLSFFQNRIPKWN